MRNFTSVKAGKGREDSLSEAIKQEGVILHGLVIEQTVISFPQQHYAASTAARCSQWTFPHFFEHCLDSVTKEMYTHSYSQKLWSDLKSELQFWETLHFPR